MAIPSINKNTNHSTKQYWLECITRTWNNTICFSEFNSEDIDWNWIVVAAKNGRIIESCSQIWKDDSRVPETVKNSAWIASTQAAHKGEKIVKVIRILQQIFTEYNLQVILLKSPSYIDEIFSGYSDRYVGDIDLLTTEGYFDQLKKGLTENGFESEIRKIMSKGKEWLFYFEDILVEVHLSSSNRRRFQRLLPTEEIVNNSVVHQSYRPLFRLSPEDECLILVLHAYHHSFREPVWLRDLVAVWETRKPSPEKIYSLFKKKNLLRIGWIAWNGMQMIGWNKPYQWDSDCWEASPFFNNLVKRFWDINLYSPYETRSLLLLRWSTEICAAQGILPKIQAISPVISVRNIRRLIINRDKITSKGPK